MKMAGVVQKCTTCKERCHLPDAHKIEYIAMKKNYYTTKNCIERNNFHRCIFRRIGTQKHDRHLCLREFITECSQINTRTKKGEKEEKTDSAKQNDSKIKEYCFCMNSFFKENQKNTIGCICHPLKLHTKELHSNSKNNTICNQLLRKKCSNNKFGKHRRYYISVNCKILTNVPIFEKKYFGETPMSHVNLSKQEVLERHSMNSLEYNMSLFNITADLLKSQRTNRTGSHMLVDPLGKLSPAVEEDEYKEEDTLDDESFYADYEEVDEEEEDNAVGDEANYDYDEEELYKVGDSRRKLALRNFGYNDAYYGKLTDKRMPSTISIERIHEDYDDMADVNNHDSFVPLYKNLIDKLTNFIQTVPSESNSVLFFSSVLVVAFLFIAVCSYVFSTNYKKKRRMKEKDLGTKLVFLKMH